MFFLSQTNGPSVYLACFLSDYGYSLVGLKNAQEVLFCENHYFNEVTPALIAESLTADVDKYSLYGQSCQLILDPSFYQLILMDALEVAENEMAKALRWQLKGLVDYPLNDIAVEAFSIPAHGAGARRKKVFVAATLQSALTNKITMIESSLLKVTAVSIAELALSKLLSHQKILVDSPTIAISYDNELCRLHLFYDNDLYLFRVLPLDESIIHPKSPSNQSLLLEIQRTIDYCLMELKLPEPKYIVFTPNFYEATDLFSYLQAEIDKEVKLLDINSFFISEPIAPEAMAKAFYAIGGAKMLLNGEN